MKCMRMYENSVNSCLKIWFASLCKSGWKSGLLNSRKICFLKFREAIIRVFGVIDPYLENSRK